MSEAKIFVLTSKMSSSLGHLASLSVCLPSLLRRVHTLMAKSCSLGSGERRESPSRS